jgi:proteasome lid subunit RPN8/RPN11
VLTFHEFARVKAAFYAQVFQVRNLQMSTRPNRVLDVTLILTEAQLAQIFVHTKAEAPNEACGLLAGLDQHVLHVLPAINVAESPTVEYLMDPHDQLHHFQTMEAQGLELLGIYHSHPNSPAYPSPTDLSMAYYPEAVYGIVSLLRSENPVMRTFRITDGRVSEVAFKLTPPEVKGNQSSNTSPESIKPYVDKPPVL